MERPRYRPARRYDWARVKTAGGKLPPAVYLCTPNPMVSLNVYRDGSAWRWVVIGFSVDGSHVLRSGMTGTMQVAMIQAEDALGRIGHPQTDMGLDTKGGHDAKPSD